MADIAFTLDPFKNFADIRVVGGDFLVCDALKTETVSTGFAPPSTIVLSCGDSRYNGIYEYNSIQNDRPKWYKSDNFNYYIVWSAGDWLLNDDIDMGSPYYVTSADYLPPKSGWSLSGGTAPAPTLVYDEDTVEVVEYLVSSLQVAVELSLFTDRRATADEIRQFQIGQERESRRGYWANSLKKYPMGSGLWLLYRETRSEANLERAKTYCEEALNWLVKEGVADSVEVDASFSGEKLILVVKITKPDGQSEDFKFDHVWGGI